MGPDWLSDLPSSIIETILTLLPIRDAIRMSVLSTKWRHRWACIPQLSFTDECVDSSDGAKHEESLKKFVTYTLFLHKGPINTFEICSSMLQSCAEVAQWILFLSRNNIRELVLDLDDGEPFIVPSSLFSCKTLTHLELVGCILKPLPSFKGFSCLKTLNLQQFLIESKDLERLISSCPLLEYLILYFNDLDLSIYAPNLKYLYLEGDQLHRLCIESSPLLKVMWISFHEYCHDNDAQEDFEKSNACNFLKVLGNVPDLERLEGASYFSPYLSIGLDLWKPHITFTRLKVIELDGVGFEDMKETMVVLKLIINSPLLQELQIGGSPFNANDDVDILDHEVEYPSCTFKLLKNVKMINMCGMPLELSLIKYLLENSPTLEKMSIKPRYDLTEVRLNRLLKFVSFCRAFSLAEVLFAPCVYNRW